MFIQNRMTGVDKGFVCHSAAARTFLHSMLLIVKEYPSRSNLNCLIVVLRGLGRKGDESRFHSGLSTSVEWGKPLSIFYHFKEHFLFSQGVWVTNLPTPTPPSFVLQSYKTFSIPTSPFLIFFHFRVWTCFTSEFVTVLLPSLAFL